MASTSVVYHNAEISLTISIGITSYYSEAESIEEIVRYADEALYTSKDGGRNRTTVKCHSV